MTGILLTLVSRGSTSLSYTAVPVISGEASERSVLTASTGVWLGAVPITFTYQWYSNSIPVGTNNTYTVQTSDIGNSIYCTVAATNFYGTITANSANTSIIAQSGPSKPVVTASAITQTSVTLNWTPAVSGVTSYDVYVGTIKLNNTALSNSTFTYSTISNDAVNTRVFLNGENFNDYSESQKGIVNTSVTLSSAKFAYGTTSYYFNGSARLLSAGNSLGIFGTSNFTIEFWLSASVPAAEKYIMSSDYFWNQVGVWSISIPTTGKLVVSLAGATILTSVTSVADANLTLRHIAIVRNGTSLNLYIGGILDKTVVISAGAVYGDVATGGAVGIVIGCRKDNATTYSSYLTGYLDEIRISSDAKYTAAFTQAQLNYGYKMLPQTSYLYYVKATNAIGVTSSDALTVVSIAAPPTGLAVSSLGTSSFVLSWTVVSGVSYTVFNGTTQFGSSQTTGNITVNSGVNAGQTYTFYVKATATGSNTATSSAGISVVMLPATPAALTASNITSAVASSTVTLTWTPVAGLTYEILNGTTSVATGLTTSPYNITTGLAEFTSYTFYLKASNTSGSATSAGTTIQTPRIPLAIPISTQSSPIEADAAWYRARGVVDSRKYDITITFGNCYHTSTTSTHAYNDYLITINGTATGNKIYLVVPSGITISGKGGGSDSDGSGGYWGGQALYIATAEVVSLTNYGNIYGGGGGGGKGGGNSNSSRTGQGNNGGLGGHALIVNANVPTNAPMLIYNYGKILGGGGGGGGGGGAINVSSSTTVSNGTNGGSSSDGNGGAGGLGGSDGGSGGSGLNGAGGVAVAPGVAGNPGARSNPGAQSYNSGGSGGTVGWAIVGSNRVNITNFGNAIVGVTTTS